MILCYITVTIHNCAYWCKKLNRDVLCWTEFFIQHVNITDKKFTSRKHISCKVLDKVMRFIIYQMFIYYYIYYTCIQDMQQTIQMVPLAHEQMNIDSFSFGND